MAERRVDPGAPVPAPDEEPTGVLARWSRRKALARRGLPLREGELDEAQAAAPRHLPAAAAGVAGRTDAAHAPNPPGPLPSPGPSDSAGAASEVSDPATERTGPAGPPRLPTLADVAKLTAQSDVREFMAAGVDESVRRAALRKMFLTDPHYNVMDGLDTYIDDYGRPDPIPAAILRKMRQSSLLGLFDEEQKRQGEAMSSGLQPEGSGHAPPIMAPDMNPSAGASAADTDAHPEDSATAGRSAPPQPTDPGRAALSPPMPTVSESQDEDPDLRLQPDDPAGRRPAE